MRRMNRKYRAPRQPRYPKLALEAKFAKNRAASEQPYPKFFDLH
jgi:hypothetical protein